jgi:hypothetical protein
MACALRSADLLSLSIGGGGAGGAGLCARRTGERAILRAAPRAACWCPAVLWILSESPRAQVRPAGPGGWSVGGTPPAVSGGSRRRARVINYAAVCVLHVSLPAMLTRYHGI